VAEPVPRAATDPVAEEVAVEQVIERLTGKFPETSPIEIAAVVREEHGKLADSPIRTFIPVLVEHEARDRLREQGHPTRPAASA
jgi:hypothetical protein